MEPVLAGLGSGMVTGTAVTRFTFETFELTKPRVAILLSIDDDIALEYDFTLRRQ